MAPVDFDEVQTLIKAHLDSLDGTLHAINRQLHGHPETAYKEVFAHDSLADLVAAQGLAVERHAYGLDTSFEATAGTGGREVVICAEYDALPDIGHACGHNLIATASLAAFLGAAHVLARLGLPGRARLLGTPAEEGGGGKARLIDAGAFSPAEGIAAAVMAHPTSAGQIGAAPGESGLAAFSLIASHKFRVEFRGRTAHAAGEPWEGVNALDAAVAGYTNVALLRQHLRPDERVHGVVEAGGSVPNVIPDYARLNWNVRAPTVTRSAALRARVTACLDAGAQATGCSVAYLPAPTYMEVRANAALCGTYAAAMRALGQAVVRDRPGHAFCASTDMGNVSHRVPSLHAAFVVPTEPGVAGHNPRFAEAAGTDEAHRRAVVCGRGLAMVVLRVLLDDGVAEAVREDFEKGVAAVDE